MAKPSATAHAVKFDLSSWPVVTQANLLKSIPELKKSHFTDEELNILIKKIYKVTRHKKIKIVKTNNTLQIHAEADSKVDEITFDSTPLLSYNDAIEVLNLGLSDAVESDKVKLALDRLVSYYKNLGYQKANASFKYIDLADFKKRLHINISIGPKTIIQALSFENIPAKDIAYLKDNIYWNFVGENLTDDRLKSINTEVRARLNQRGLFLISNISPQILYNSDDTRVTLLYKFNPKTKYEINIVGNRYFSETHLKSEVLNLAEYSPSDESFPDEIQSKLQRFYLAEGYSQSQVKYTLAKQNDQNVLTYTITENYKTRIYKLKITGSLSRSEKFYINLFDEYASTSVQNRVFIRADIDQATQNLVMALKNQGFVNAKLKRLEMITDEAYPERGLVTINIDEGAQTRIASLEFKNAKNLAPSELLKSMELSDSQLLNLNEFEQGLNKLQLHYANQGFLEMRIANLESESLIQYSNDFTSARIMLEIVEGPQIYVNSILIDGNNKTHDRVILTELEFSPGELLTLSRLQESTARLQKTGLFSSIEIKTLESNTDVAQRTIIVTVGERKPGVATIGGGVTNENDFTMRGYLGWAYRNIGGWGRGVSLRGEGSYNPTILNFLESKFTLGYLEPYLFDTRLRFRLNYTTSRTVTDYLIRRKTITNQAIWSVEQDITSNITGIWQIYNIANYVDEGITKDDEIRYGYTRDDLVIASTGPILDLDYRDNVLNPMTGNFSRISIEYASNMIGSNKTDDFLRYTAQTTFYFNVYKQMVWANSLRGGYLQPLKINDEGVRFDKKGFILGGRTTIRGFESNEFFPSTDTEKTSEAISPNLRLSGNTSYELFKSEMRFPLMKKSDLSGAIFYDGGQVHISSLPSTTSYKAEWRSSVGIGIRYNLPIGPLNLEYAQKLNKKSYESDGAFHLSVGVF